MDAEDEYQGYEGKWWSLPPCKILPKPRTASPHPAMWYAAGNTSSYAMAARYGLGVLGFSVQSIDQLAPVLEAYKEAIPNAEPIGAFVNDNIMITSGASRGRGTATTARSWALAPHSSYLISNAILPLPRHLSPPA